MNSFKIENYIESFFEDIQNFKILQQKQKMRGLNDYNIVNVVRHESAEVGMHSNIIYSLINPNGLHYQDDLFLKLFIQYIIEPELQNSIEGYSDFGNVFEVQVEEITSENRRIDFTIKSNKFFIGIEMKIYANDLEKQIFHYYTDLVSKAKDHGISEENVIIFYLTIDGKDAPKYSYANYSRYKKISFKKHILKWIEKSQEQVSGITNLNEAFSNYKSIVQKITNTYKGKTMSLVEKLKENNEYFKMAEEIYKVYPELCTNLEYEFWVALVNHFNGEKSFNREKNIFTEDKIKNARAGGSSEINLHFNIINIDETSKVMLQIGVSNYSKGIYASVYKYSDGWQNPNMDDDRDFQIKEIISELGKYGFKFGKWYYGTTIIDNQVGLRDDKLSDALSHTDRLSRKIKTLIDDLQKNLQIFSNSSK
jgi:hypothetical protein